MTWAIREKSYSQRRACRLADRGYVLVHGQIVLSADDPQALQQNELVRKYYLGVGEGSRKTEQQHRLHSILWFYGWDCSVNRRSLAISDV